MNGKKFDEDKLRWDLLPVESIEKIIEVLQYGANKYEENNWQEVSFAKRRYFNAAMRHLAEYKKGKAIDSESGLKHIAHAACNLLFLVYFEEENNSD